MRLVRLAIAHIAPNTILPIDAVITVLTVCELSIIGYNDINITGY